MADIQREIFGETFAFLPEKAVHWPGRRTLMVADLHWGKAEIFQQAGIPVSSSILQDDLERLRGLIHKLGIKRLILLGDLMHGRQGLTADLADSVCSWRQSIDADILFVRGNHDKHVTVPGAWNMQVVSEPYKDGVFQFRHHPLPTPSMFAWCGHLHPVIRVGPRHDRLRLPCFWLQAGCGILPSFGSFTGGAVIRPARADQVYAIAEESVFSLQ